MYGVHCWPDSLSESLQNLRGHPDGFSCGLTSVQLKKTNKTNKNSLRCYSQGQNCLRWLSLIVSSSSAKKESVFCSCVGFLLSADPSSIKSNSFYISGTLEMGFLWTTPAMMPVFLRPFTNVLIILFAWSEIMGNGLLPGGV